VKELNFDGLSVFYYYYGTTFVYGFGLGAGASLGSSFNPGKYSASTLTTYCCLGLSLLPGGLQVLAGFATSAGFGFSGSGTFSGSSAFI